MVPRGHLHVPGWRTGPGSKAEADDDMPREGLPEASERAGGESRPCLDSSERKHWTKCCSAHQSIPPTTRRRRELQNPKAKKECKGFKVNIWNRVRGRR